MIEAKDLWLLGEGRHERLYDKLGAHPCVENAVEGTRFAVWAPNASAVHVIGDFNGWNTSAHPMRGIGDSGVWQCFVPEAHVGARYKFEITTREGHRQQRADPFARRSEIPPKTASIIWRSSYEFGDDDWMDARRRSHPYREPLSVYELHLGSWKHVQSGEGGPVSYREVAEPLVEYVKQLGFTHVEFMPLMEHPFGGSWGYQVTGYFAPTARYGTPDDLKYLIDCLHQNGIGVIFDWVPAHFPRDEFALARFDGTALFEHADPKKGAHPDWGTLVFNYGRHEVKNFLLANALYWLEEFHVDGLRLDAVASMLYLDYSRKQGEWIPNVHGGRENLEAITFLRELNSAAHGRCPGVLMIAEESTAWPSVSRPIESGGLGFGFKWNMGWMHDTLEYFSKKPVHRRFHHDRLTFGLLYAFTEHYILPFSHDEVVYGKASMLSKMPGDRWQQFANLRALYAYMWAHPGKKHLFMGSEFGQVREWDHDGELEWHCLFGEEHVGLQRLVSDLNRIYRDNSALWAADSEPDGFSWLLAMEANNNVIAFCRTDPRTGRKLVSVSNLSPVVRESFAIPLPAPGTYREVLNTDSTHYRGSDRGNFGEIEADAKPLHGHPASARITLPPLSTLWLESTGSH